MIYHVNPETSSGRHLRPVPRSISPPVRIMEALRPLTSKNQRTGITGMMYMMLPQLPSKAKVESDQSGQKMANRDVEMGPNEFHIMPFKNMVT